MPVLLTRHLWDQMQLGEIIRSAGGGCRLRRQKFDVAETAFVLMANRLCTDLPRIDMLNSAWPVGGIVPPSVALEQTSAAPPERTGLASSSLPSRCHLNSDCHTLSYDDT